MMCEHCEKRVRDCLEALSEVEAAQCDYKTGKVKIILKEEADVKKIKKAVSSAGYKMK
jgi:Cu2+-exporting ATPase